MSTRVRVRVAAMGLLCAIGLTGAAEAGWRDRPGSIKDTPYVERFSWSGLYAGGHAGWAFADVDRTNSIGDHFVPAGGGISHDHDSWYAGLHVGVQQQYGQFVIGIEGAMSGGDLVDTGFSTSLSPVGSDPVQHRLEFGPIYSAVLRVGYAWGKTLAYVKGGYAASKVETTSWDSADHVGASNRWQHGYTLGAGMEWALTPNAIFGLEYNFIDLGTKDYPAAISAGAAPRYQFPTIDADIHSIVARISFKTN